MTTLITAAKETKRVAAFTFPRDLSHVAYILVTHVKIMR